MECNRTADPDAREYLQQFRDKLAEQHIPFEGSLELTRSCNLHCVHCYLRDQKSVAGERDQELSTKQWCAILDEITEAGCLFLLITGGEPLLRRDFAQIYRYARLKGLIVDVFSNGTLVTDELVQVFKDLPPRSVEISLYGATPETYERITGVQGSYDRCIKGIQRLLNAGVKVGLKTILMTLNRHEFTAIKQKALDYGVSFRFDAAIFSRFNGDRSPLQLRVPVQEAIEHDFADMDRKRKWQEYYTAMFGSPVSDNMYTCGTGLNSFHITARGKLQPCLMVTDIQYDLRQGDFLTGWNTVIPTVRDKKLPRNHPCKGCEVMPFCNYCPPVSVLDNDSEEQLSPYLCKMGRLRLQHIHSFIRSHVEDA